MPSQSLHFTIYAALGELSKAQPEPPLYYVCCSRSYPMPSQSLHFTMYAALEELSNAQPEPPLYYISNASARASTLLCTLLKESYPMPSQSLHFTIYAALGELFNAQPEPPFYYVCCSRRVIQCPARASTLLCTLL